jgi:hypothetical protein
MNDAHAFCRALEGYLCRKNDGHLIRIVGPAFDRVVSWAEQGIPIKVAQAGIDRYFERYYRKGPRRRPVRIEFCEADVLDAFDEWRRAVGVSVVTVDVEGGPATEDPAPVPARPRRSLRGHIEALVARLTVLRGSDRWSGAAGEAIEVAWRACDALISRAEKARGDDRQAVIASLTSIEEALVSALTSTLDAREREAMDHEVQAELEPFRERMARDAYEQALRAAGRRGVRERFGLPEFGF